MTTALKVQAVLSTVNLGLACFIWYKVEQLIKKIDTLRKIWRGEE